MLTDLELKVDKTTRAPSPKVSSGSSAFSFISPEESANSDEDDGEESHSSFSFIAQKPSSPKILSQSKQQQPPMDPIVQIALPATGRSSPTATLPIPPAALATSASVSSPSPFLDLMSTSSPPELKLAKLAQTKVVKKKKKSSRVGVNAYDDAEDDAHTKGSFASSTEAPFARPPAPPQPSHAVDDLLSLGDKGVIESMSRAATIHSSFPSALHPATMSSSHPSPTHPVYSNSSLSLANPGTSAMLVSASGSGGYRSYSAPTALIQPNTPPSASNAVAELLAMPPSPKSSNQTSAPASPTHVIDLTASNQFFTIDSKSDSLSSATPAFAVTHMPDHHNVEDITRTPDERHLSDSFKSNSGPTSDHSGVVRMTGAEKQQRRSSIRNTLNRIFGNSKAPTKEEATSVTPSTSFSKYSSSSSVSAAEKSDVLASENHASYTIPSLTQTAAHTPVKSETGVEDDVSEVLPSITAAAIANTGGSSAKSKFTDDNSSSLKPRDKMSSQENFGAYAREVADAFAAEVMALAETHHRNVKTQQELRVGAEIIERNLVELRTRVSNLEAEQQRLALDEEFDRADSFTVLLDALRSDIRTQSTQLQRMYIEEREVDAAVRAHSQQQRRILERILSNMEGIRRKQEQELQKFEREADHRVGSEDSRLRQEEERVALERMHIEREESVLEEEAKVTEDAITGQSGDLIERRNSKRGKLDSLLGEISALEELLEQKYEEKDLICVEMEELDSKVNEVRKKYDRQLQRIQDRRHALETAKTDCKAEEDVVLRERSAHELNAALTAQTGRKLRLICDNLDAEVPIVELVRISLQMACPSNDGVMRSGAGSDTEQAAEHQNFVRTLKERCAVADAAFMSAETALAELKQRSDALTKESSEIEDRLPKLEGEKKAHATAKRFKEASVVAKDLKALTSRKEEIESESMSIALALSSKTEEVAQCLRRQEEATLELKESKKLAAAARFSLLRTRVAMLRKAERVVFREMATLKMDAEGIGSSSSFGDNDGNDGDSIPSFLQPLLFMLHAELQGFCLEAEDLKAEYKLSESLEDPELDLKGQETNEKQLSTDAYNDASLERSDTAAAKSDEDTLPISIAPSSESLKPSEPSVGNDILAITSNGSTHHEAVAAPEAAEEEKKQEDGKEAADVAAVQTEALRLLKRLSGLSEVLDAATEDEDYDKAAEIDEEMSSLQADMDNLLDVLNIGVDDLIEIAEAKEREQSTPRDERGKTDPSAAAGSEATTTAGIIGASSEYAETESEEDGPEEVTAATESSFVAGEENSNNNCDTAAVVDERTTADDSNEDSEESSLT